MRRILSRFLVAVLVTVGVPGATRSSARGEDGGRGPEREITLVAGEQKVLDASSVASFSESAKGIIEVKVPRDGKRMVITAVRPGSTSLLLIERGGGQRTIPIAVYARRPAAIEREIRDLLGDLGDVRMRRIGPRIFLDGTVAGEADLARVERVAGLYPGQVESLARVDQSVVRPRTNIRFDLTFVEMRSAIAWGAGVNWPGQVGAAQSFDLGWEIGGGVPSASYQVVDQALPFLEAASEAGWVKIRKRATLVTTSGNRASYESGGEVNVAVAGSQAAELRTVPYGCKLDVLPYLDPGPGLIDLKVEAEVSDLSETSQDVPGRTVSRVSTLVHLGLGQSIVLSGMDGSYESRSKSGIPGLSRIPIFGMLFGVHRRRAEEVDGMIAVTPVVIDNLDREGKRKLSEALERFEAFKG